MGSWGHGLLENDAAGDVAVFWDEYVERGRAKDPAFWTSRRIFRLFRQSYFRGLQNFDVENSERNAEVLGVGALFLKHDIPIPKELTRLLARCASAELRQAKLSLWNSPRLRRRALEKFLADIGAKPLKVKTKAHPVEREITALQKWSRQYPRWIHSAKNLVADDRWAQLEPGFLKALWKLVGKGAWHPREELANRLMMHRLMCLAFLTGMFCQLSEDEMQDLINRAKATTGDVPAAFMLAEDE